MRLLLTLFIVIVSSTILIGKERELTVTDDYLLIYSKPDKQTIITDTLGFFDRFQIIDYLYDGWVAVQITYKSEKTVTESEIKFAHKNDYLYNTMESGYEPPNVLTYRLARNIRENIIRTEFKTGIDFRKTIPIAVTLFFIAAFILVSVTKNNRRTGIILISLLIVAISLLEIIYIPVMQYDFWFIGIDRWGWVRSMFQWIFTAILLCSQIVLTMKVLFWIKAENEDKTIIFFAFKGIYILMIAFGLYGLFVRFDRAENNAAIIGILILLVIQAIITLIQLIKRPSIAVAAALLVSIGTFGIICFSIELISLAILLLWLFAFIPLKFFTQQGIEEWSKKMDEEKKRKEEEAIKKYQEWKKKIDEEPNPDRSHSTSSSGYSERSYGYYKRVSHDRSKILAHQNRDNPDYEVPDYETEQLIGSYSCYRYNEYNGNCEVDDEPCSKRTNEGWCRYSNFTESEIEREIEKNR